MAVTRNVHKFSGAGLRNFDAWEGAKPNKFTKMLNEKLASNERIVGTHYVDGDWVIITETYGLGPANTP